MKKTMLGIACCCMAFVSLNAQTLVNGMQTNWAALTISENTPFGQSTDYHRKSSIIYISDAEAVVPVVESRTNMRIIVTDDFSWSITKVNNKGQTKWKSQQVDGYLLGMAEYRGV